MERITPEKPQEGPQPIEPDSRSVELDQDEERLKTGFTGQLGRVPVWPLLGGQMRQLSRTGETLYLLVCVRYANWTIGGLFWPSWSKIASDSRIHRGHLSRAFNELLASYLIVRAGWHHFETRWGIRRVMRYRIVASQAEAEQISREHPATQDAARVARYRESQKGKGFGKRSGAHRAPGPGAHRAPRSGAHRAPRSGAHRAPGLGAHRAPSLFPDLIEGTVGVTRTTTNAPDVVVVAALEKAEIWPNVIAELLQLGHVDELHVRAAILQAAKRPAEHRPGTIVTLLRDPERITARSLDWARAQIAAATSTPSPATRPPPPDPEAQRAGLELVKAALRGEAVHP